MSSSRRSGAGRRPLGRGPLPTPSTEQPGAAPPSRMDGKPDAATQQARAPDPASPFEPGSAAPTPHPGGSAPSEPPHTDSGDRVGGAAPVDATGDTEAAGEGGFAVRLDNFEGPFDLLLGLIAKHKLDVTEVALSRVTDEFIAYIRAQGPDWELDQASRFLVVAATLLDLKAARLLPAAQVEDEEDLALLEARDLLFARLLQYRAYKQIAAILDERWQAEGRRHPRAVALEPRYTGLLPQVVLEVEPERFARLAARAMTPKPPRSVPVEHIHAPRVSVREQGEVVVAILRALGTATFARLVADAPDTLHVVARFLVLLELFRDSAVAFDQPQALGELSVRWTAGQDDPHTVGAEFDEDDPGGDGPDGGPAPAPGPVPRQGGQSPQPPPAAGGTGHGNSHGDTDDRCEEQAP